MKQQYNLTEQNRNVAAYGLEHLAKAFCCGTNRNDEFVREVKLCMRQLQEFLGDINPLPALTKLEAEVSGNLHTYLRKLNDEPYSVIIYRMVHESRGLGIWYAFVKGAAADAKKLNFHRAIQEARNASDKCNTTDDLIMLAALQMWEPNCGIV